MSRCWGFLLRSLIVTKLLPRLPRSVWIILALRSLPDIGVGMTYAFTMIYFHSIRGFSLPVAGLILAVSYGAGILAGGLGRYVDRHGPLIWVIIGSLGMALGAIGYALATTVPIALMVAGEFGIAGGLFYTSTSTLFANEVDESSLRDVFGTSYATMNLGLAVGGALASLIANVHSPFSFQVLFWCEAAAATVFALLMAIFRPGRGGPATHPGASEPPTGETTVSRPTAGRHRPRWLVPIVVLWLIECLTVFAGVGQLDNGFPVYVVTFLHDPARVIGAGFVANTLIIVIIQIPVLHLTRRFSHRSLIAAGAILYGAAWPLAWLGGFHAFSSALRIAALVSVPAIIGIGETLQSASVPALTNELALPAQRGRYNAWMTSAWQVGPMMGAPIAGLLLASGSADRWLLLLMVLCGVVALATLALPKTGAIGGLSAATDE